MINKNNREAKESRKGVRINWVKSLVVGLETKREQFLPPDRLVAGICDFCDGKNN